MGFIKRRGGNYKNSHRWINYPNTMHKKCTICGCYMDQKSVNGVSTTTYRNSEGEELESNPECK